jgi:hypothetical protein
MRVLDKAMSKPIPDDEEAALKCLRRMQIQERVLTLYDVAEAVHEVFPRSPVGCRIEGFIRGLARGIEDTELAPEQDV